MKRLVMVLFMLLLTACDTTIDLLPCDGNEIAGICVDTVAPQIEGVGDIALYQHASFDPLDGVRAMDNSDGDLTNQMDVFQRVDTSELGTYVVTYSVMDSFSNETIVLRYITIIPDPSTMGGNMVRNSSFDDHMDGYAILNNPDGGHATFEVINGVLQINVQNTVSSIPWEPRLDYQQLIFERGVTYHVSFDIYAEHTRQFEVHIGELIPYDPWFINYSPTHQYRLLAEPTWTTFEFDFTMSAPTSYNGCILFHFGAMGTTEYMETTFYVDNVEIHPLN